MKNNLIKIYSSLFCLLTSFLAFSQPGTGSDTGNLETPDSPSAPIDSKLLVLIVIGILFAFYTLRKKGANRSF